MLTKYLVAYATKSGSTKEVAEHVAAALRERGVEADLKPAREVRILKGYTAVVLGAPLKVSRRWRAQFNPKGVLKWKTFLGDNVVTIVRGITLDGNGKVYLAGDSNWTWRDPKHPYSDGNDGLIAKIE